MSITNTTASAAPDVAGEVSKAVAALEPLPECVEANLAFVRRLPSQRMLDALAKLDPTPFTDLLQQTPSRVLAFRVLVRDYPLRDISSLWMHAYDCEVELGDVDPTSLLGPTSSPPSAPTTT